MNKPVILSEEADDTLRRSLKEVLVRRGFGVIESFDKPGILVGQWSDEIHRDYSAHRPDLSEKTVIGGQVH